MDQYFEHVERKIQTNSHYPPRIRFLLRDVIELRNNNWIPRKIARTDGPVPMQDLNTDEDILRGGSAAYLHRQQRDHRHNERDSNHWMSKLPLNLQSTGFNDMFSSLSVTGGTSSLIPSFSPQQNSYNNRNDMRDNRGGSGGGGSGGGHGGGHDSHRGGHRSYNNNNNNQRNHHQYQDGSGGNNGGHNNNYNPRFNKHNQHHGGGGGSGGSSSSSGHQNQNNSHNNSYHHQNNQQQNNMLNNKDIAPRFKRTMMTPNTQTNTVDTLEMRPNQNSLLYKASQSMKQQQPLPLQPPSSNNQPQNNSPYIGRNSNPEQSRGGPGGHQTSNGHYNNQHQNSYGQNRNSNWNSNYNNQHGTNNKGHHGPMPHSGNDNNFQTSPFGPTPGGHSLGSNTLLSQTKNAVGKPMAVVAPTTSTPINNIMMKDQIPIKQAPEKAGKKEKKDKGPGKEEFMKLVNAFVSESLLKEDTCDSKLIEENGEIVPEENGIVEKESQELSNKKDEDVVNITDDQELKKVGRNSMEDKVAAFLELKVPDKFMKDAVIKILTETLDKEDGIHDRIIEFLLAMRKENKLTNSALVEAFKNVINTMNEKEKTIPKITTIIASLLSRAVMAKLCKLSDIANYAENGQHYPLFLLVLQQLHKKMGKHPLQELFNASKVNLMSSLPEVDRTKDRMAEILEDRSLSFLYPLLRVQAELWKQITTDPNPQAFYKFVKESIESSLYTDPGFITALMTVVVKYITKVRKFC